MTKKQKAQILEYLYQNNFYMIYSSLVSSALILVWLLLEIGLIVMDEQNVLSGVWAVINPILIVIATINLIYAVTNTIIIVARYRRICKSGGL